MEIERQWLMDKSVLERPEVKNSDYVAQITQMYGQLNPEIRIRSKKYIVHEGWRINLAENYYLTLKSDGNLSRIEVEKTIAYNDFLDLKKLFNITQDPITKTLWSVVLPGGQVLEVNLVDEGKPTEFVYAEIEFDDAHEAKYFETPDWFGKEVTYDDYYKMKNFWDRTRLNK